MGFFDSIGKIAKAVVKSPITKAIAGGLAIVVPPVGAGAIAGLAAANVAVDAIDSASPQKKAAGAKVIAATAAAAKAGDAAAKVAVQNIALIQQAKKGNPVARAAVKQRLNTGFKQLNEQAKKGDKGAQSAVSVMKKAAVAFKARRKVASHFRVDRRTLRVHRV